MARGDRGGEVAARRDWRIERRISTPQPRVVTIEADGRLTCEDSDRLWRGRCDPAED